MAEGPKHNPSGHSSKYYHRHPEARANLASTVSAKEGNPPSLIAIIFQKFFLVMENPFVLGVLLLFAAILIYFYIWALVLLGLLLLIGVHKSGVIPATASVGRKLLWYCLVAIVIAAMMYAIWDLINREFHPRAYLHVDNVSVEIDWEGAVHPIPMNVIAHINGHNVSTSVPTYLDPMVQASITIRPPISPQHVAEEGDLFTHGTWAGEAYFGYQHALNPLEPFSFSKTEPLDDEVPFSFDTWNKIERGDLVIYVVTRAIYSDKWGRLPEAHSCSTFGAKTDFRRFSCWGEYQQ